MPLAGSPAAGAQAKANAATEQTPDDQEDDDFGTGHMDSQRLRSGTGTSAKMMTRPWYPELQIAALTGVKAAIAPWE